MNKKLITIASIVALTLGATSSNAVVRLPVTTASASTSTSSSVSNLRTPSVITSASSIAKLPVKTISNFEVTVTQPVYGEKYDKTITIASSNISDKTMSWINENKDAFMEADQTFEEGKYTCRVFLTIESNCVLGSTLTGKINGNEVSVTKVSDSQVKLTYTFDVTKPVETVKEISNVKVTAVPKAAVGETADNKASSVKLEDSTNVAVTSSTWAIFSKDALGRSAYTKITDRVFFESDKTKNIGILVTLESKNSYKFTKDVVLSYNGKEYTASSYSETKCSFDLPLEVGDGTYKPVENAKIYVMQPIKNTMPSYDIYYDEDTMKGWYLKDPQIIWMDKDGNYLATTEKFKEDGEYKVKLTGFYVEDGYKYVKGSSNIEINGVGIGSFTNDTLVSLEMTAYTKDDYEVQEILDLIDKSQKATSASEEETKTTDTTTEDTKQEEAKTTDTKTEDAKQEETKTTDTKAEDTKQEETKTADTKTEDAKQNEIKTEDNSTSEVVISEKQWSNASSWAVPQLISAQEANLIPEILKNEDMTKSITRTEFAAVAVRLYEKISGKTAETVSKNPFTDTNNEEVLKAYNLGITNGISETEFAPDNLITREQMATMMTRAITKAGIDTKVDMTSIKAFDDDSTMSNWSKDSVYYMNYNGIINGVGHMDNIGDNCFNAKGNATREQSLLISYRAVNALKK